MRLISSLIHLLIEPDIRSTTVCIASLLQATAAVIALAQTLDKEGMQDVDDCRRMARIPIVMCVEPKTGPAEGRAPERTSAELACSFGGFICLNRGQEQI